MAGGTGGHIYPALAVATALREHGVEVHWLGTPHGMEVRLIPAANFAISYISIKGLRGKGALGWVLAPVRIVYAILQALRVLHGFKPDVVLGMGGFVTGPGGIAAWLRRVPLLIHEQNAVMGLTNRRLAMFARRVLSAFPHMQNYKPAVIHTGNPVRDSILRLAVPSQRYDEHAGPIRLLAVGGSLGAQALNECLPQTIYQLPETQRPEVWHQTGRNKLSATQSEYAKRHLDVRLDEFIDDMDAAYAWADLIICRAGAMTVSEVSAAGVASIFVPYPHAVDDHQTVNAEFLRQIGAAIVIQQKDLSPSGLAQVLADLINAGRKKLMAMAVAARSFAKQNATENVMQQCLEVAGG